MFQSFDSPSRPDQGPPRLAALRDAMAGDRLDAYIVPRADRFQGEYVAPRDDRLAWLTGFTGSAGFCVVTCEKAAVFIDGRYRVQVRAQVAPDFPLWTGPPRPISTGWRANCPRAASWGLTRGCMRRMKSRG